jgi:CRP-like cAMP-binding protein
MFNEFETFIKSQTDLTPADIALMRSVAVEKTLRRKEVLLHSAEKRRYKIFVSKGLLRNYCTKQDGREHIIHFVPENSWTINAETHDGNNTFRYDIDALENSEVVMWPQNDFEYLFDNIPGLKVYSNNLISRSMSNVRKRLLSAISSTPEERYDEFVENYPEVFSRVPLHMVASYLGVSLKTLSRIRHAQVTR